VADRNAAGCWHLGAGRALTLQPREAGELSISQGRVWATFDGPHPGPANDRGDLVLKPGERLQLKAGQRVVLESWGAAANASATSAANAPAWFVWQTQPAQLPLGAHSGSRWQLTVAQPARELGHALWQTVQAFGRLIWGVAGYSEFMVAGRGRVMPVLESNQP
jgi:hypothetical protein